jgi:hypothetical protein
MYSPKVSHIGLLFVSLIKTLAEWLISDHPSQDGTAVSKIEKIVIADKDQLAESWFKSEILGALAEVTIDWVDPSTNDGDNGIVAVHLSTPNGSVVLD